jgi:hypothetical protein
LHKCIHALGTCRWASFSDKERTRWITAAQERLVEPIYDAASIAALQAEDDSDDDVPIAQLFCDSAATALEIDEPPQVQQNTLEHVFDSLEDFLLLLIGCASVVALHCKARKLVRECHSTSSISSSVCDM